jgi:hypothetical protein
MSNRERAVSVSDAAERALRLVEAQGYVVAVEWNPQPIPGRLPLVIQVFGIHPEAPEHLHVGRSYDEDPEEAAEAAARALMCSVGLDPEYV